jgi:dTDP-D-glucose 4,6-dehydratase
VSWDEGVLHTIRWYAENRDRWIGRVDWLEFEAMTRVLVTGGGGFLGSHLVERLRERGDDPFVAAAPTTT